MKKLRLGSAILGFLVFAQVLQAGTTGKIVGQVTDVETSEPLPGVNVVIEGTELGAATDEGGNYLILNVPPGKYALRFSMIGYAPYVVRGVEIVIDRTTRVDAKLRQKVLQGKEVVVVARPPMVVKDVSNSQMNLASETVVSMPVHTVEEALSLQAGIERSPQGLLVRGGSANQTVFMVDGLSLNDERSNIPYAAVSLSAIREVQVQTGGFNAEYGNVRSGLVNVVTKEGSKRTYNGSLIGRYSFPAPKHFGPSVYDRFSYFNRPYEDPAVCWTGTNNGAWDAYTQRQYPHFEGWEAVSEATLQDQDPSNDLTPEGAKRLYEWQHRRQGDIKKPDYVLDFGFGGPFPGISHRLGDLRFFLTHFRLRDMFVFPLSRDSYQENHTQLKLTSDVTPAIRVSLTGLYGEVHSVSPYNWKTTPTGRVLRTTEEVANLLNSTSGNAILYMPGYFSPSSIYRTMVGAKITHVLSPVTFYEVSVEHLLSRYNTFKIADRDTTKRYEPVPGYFVDEAPYGYWGYSVTGIDGMIMGGWMNLGRDKSVNATTSLKFDITSQVNLRHQLKAGFNVVYNDYNIRSYTESPSMSTWNRTMEYRVFPFRVGAYVQDKMEFQGFIANLGLRLDYSNANTWRFALDPYDKLLAAGYGNKIEREAKKERAEPHLSLSPRVGISHPITESSKLYFNYGHFRSEPPSSYRFRIQREATGLVTYLGEPNMRFEKTVAYELGYAQSLMDMFLINVAAYYKDITDQPGWIFYQSIDNSVQYYRAANNNYQDIRGLEITLRKRTGRWLTGFVNYTYHVSTSGYFGLTRYFEDPNKQRDYLRLNPYQSKPHPRPFARASVDVHTPADFGPAWWHRRLRPLANWNVNILADWKAGAYETYNPHNIPGIVDNVRWKDWYNVDARISKLLRFGRVAVELFADIRNVFNFKHLSRAAFSDKYDYLDYLESLNFSWEKGVEHGNDKIGDYRPEGVAYDPLEPNPNNDPEIAARNARRKKNKSYIDMPNFKSLTFLNPRDVFWGVRITF